MLKKINRNICICIKCNKEKLHFGNKMCSACLRNTKRKTKPSFYLGTCYSEISRRCKTYDPLRPNYYGKTKCSREEFFNRFIEDKTFLKLFKGWQKSFFKRGFAPSIDRIDVNGNYTIDNLQFLRHDFHNKKDQGFHYKLYKNNKFIKDFESQADLADFLKLHKSILCNKLKITNNIKNYRIERINV